VFSNQAPPPFIISDSAQIVSYLRLPVHTLNKKGNFMDNNYIPTAFDEKTQNKDLQILKTALPYMRGSRQKEILTLIKSIELKKSLDLIDSDDTSLSICSTDNPMENTVNMLSDIRQFCSEQEQEHIDMILNIFSMFSTYGTMFS